VYLPIILMTPDVRPRTSVISWILFFLVILFVIAVLTALLISAFRK
jgi:hypothetical protein